MRRALVLVPELEEYARYRAFAVQHAAEKGEAAIAFNIDECSEATILATITAPYAWASVADVLAVYVDLGMTHQMAAITKFARSIGVPVEYRTLQPDRWAEALLVLIRRPDPDAG